MKKSIPLLFLFLPFFLQAQDETTDFSSYAGTFRSDLVKSKDVLTLSSYTGEEPGSRKKRTGKTLMTIGGSLFVAGNLLYWSSDRDLSIYLNGQTSNGTYGAVNQKAELGFVMIAAGVGLFVPGVIIYSKGNKQFKAYDEQNTVSLHIKGNGLALRWRL